MELKIGGKEYELRFGIKFINELDNTYKQNMDGAEFGMGIEMLNAYLEMGRPTALYNAILAGTAHLKSKPSRNKVEEYLEELAMQEDEAYEQLFDQMKEEIEQAPFLKRALKNMKKNQK